MVALAIIEDVDEIGIWGVDATLSDNEYFHQLPCMHAWLGIAKGRGIAVTLAEQCNMYDTPDPLYGRTEEHDRALAPFTSEAFHRLEKEHAKRVADLGRQIEQLTGLRQSHDGSRQVYERLALTAKRIENGQVIQCLEDVIQIK
jgi:hypothetical protein